MKRSELIGKEVKCFCDKRYISKGRKLFELGIFTLLIRPKYIPEFKGVLKIGNIDKAFEGKYYIFIELPYNGSYATKIFSSIHLKYKDNNGKWVRFPVDIEMDIINR